MATFAKLEDSPMFRKQLFSLEQSMEELKDRCNKFSKGCKKLMLSIEEGRGGNISFADCLEAFGSGHDDPLSVSIGGPVISKFTNAFRELASYKELLRSQVEHMLIDRLALFLNVDLHDTKDCRRRFDKATLAYDQAREKFMSIKKGTRAEVVAGLEEDLHNSKSAFDRCRFNLVSAVTNIEAKKKYIFLESISAVMDAHLRYFKQGYELLSNMEPYIHEILTFVQQSKETAYSEQEKLDKKIQDFRTQAELELDSLHNSCNVETSASGDGIHFVGVSSYKNIEALMHSTAYGKVETIKEGYLLKRSSNLRGDWRRRFFVLDSHGTLYYYRTKWSKTQGSNSQQSTSIPEQGSGMFGRFKFGHNRTVSQGEENFGCHSLDLRTATIKMDAEQSDLRFCFRVISPLKSYTLQAENGVERKDWVDKITGVIASLLTSPFPEQPLSLTSMDSNDSVEAGGLASSSDGPNSNEGVMDDNQHKGHYDSVSKVLREISGNSLCAECSAPEPEWASLNLGILMCIECSGVHRNLGVHISKVRSLTLDVKVWEPTILDLFRMLGNAFCNSVWEELLHVESESRNETESTSITKPSAHDAFSSKEKYIHSKYVDKMLIVKGVPDSDSPSPAIAMWEAVKSNNIQAAYRLLVTSDAKPNTSYDEVNASDLLHPAEGQNAQNNRRRDKQHDPNNCPRIKDSGDSLSCLQGGSLLHLACHGGDLVMVELLLQFGADINKQDFHGRTPLHHCIARRSDSFAKYLVKRGARPTIRDGGGQTALEREMELGGAITDEQLFVLLAGSD